MDSRTLVKRVAEPISYETSPKRVYCKILKKNKRGYARFSLLANNYLVNFSCRCWSRNCVHEKLHILPYNINKKSTLIFLTTVSYCSQQTNKEQPRMTPNFTKTLKFWYPFICYAAIIKINTALIGIYQSLVYTCSSSGQ